MLAPQNRWPLNLRLTSTNRMRVYSFSEAALANGIVHGLSESADVFAEVLSNFGGHVCIETLLSGDVTSLH